MFCSLNYNAVTTSACSATTTKFAIKNIACQKDEYTGKKTLEQQRRSHNGAWQAKERKTMKMEMKIETEICIFI